MTKIVLKPGEAFRLDESERLSFANSLAVPYRVTGPLRLVRLVRAKGNPAGSYWFEEEVFRRLRERATRDLLRQQREGSGPSFARSLQDLVGMYMKLCLRSNLAICKDWTPDFDAYVVMSLGATDSMIAWMGKIGNQPYYSPPNPKEDDYVAKKKIYDLAESTGVSLLATERQYVMHFDFPANLSLKKLIQTPRPF